MGKRQGIMTALKTQLGNISIANGYNTDIGTTVDEWHVASYDVDDLPVIEVRDSDSSAEEDMNNVLSNKNLDIAIVVYNSVSSAAATNARLYIEDVLKAISTDLTLGGNTDDINEGISSIDAAQESDIILAATVNISAKYQVNKWSD